MVLQDAELLISYEYVTHILVYRIADMSKQPNSQLFHKPYAPVYLMPGKTGVARRSHATEQGRAFLVGWRAEAAEALGSQVGKRFIEGFEGGEGDGVAATAAAGGDSDISGSHVQNLIKNTHDSINRQSALVRGMETIHLEEEHLKHDTSAVRYIDAITKNDYGFRILVLLLIALGFTGYYVLVA